MPVSSKSVASTFDTSSLNVTLNVGVASFVSSAVGTDLRIEVMVGGVVSAGASVIVKEMKA